jgi:HPt (histidine-containing phosphotransfer) domain-containing protein
VIGYPGVAADPAGLGDPGGQRHAASSGTDRLDAIATPFPEDGPIDIGHLGRMTLGDPGLERQVLTMFSAQTVSLVGALGGLPADAGALAHKLKGSARAIGAFRLADAAGALEAAIRHGGDPTRPLCDLTDAAEQARAAIAAMLRAT